jgi:sporulation protein YlmC with PRC-barrel domain
MSAGEIRLDRLLGRRVRDTHGRSIGRIEELVCEIELHEQGRDYVVREFQVGSFGALESLAGIDIVRQLLHTLGQRSGYKRYRIPWQWMDLSDAAYPRIDRGASTLTSGEDDK